MLEVMHHKEGSDINRTPEASVSRIISADEFGAFGEEIGSTLVDLGFVEVGICADLRSDKEKSDLLFSVQAVSLSGDKEKPYRVISIQGDKKRAKLFDEIDYEDMPPWQATMDCLSIDLEEVEPSHWNALEILHSYAWQQTMEAFKAAAESESVMGTPSDTRSPLRRYLFHSR